MKYANHTYYKHVRRYVHMCMEMYLDGSLRKVVLSEEYHIGFQCQGYTNVSSFGVGNRFWTSVKCVLWLISTSFSNVLLYVLEVSGWLKSPVFMPDVVTVCFFTS